MTKRATKTGKSAPTVQPIKELENGSLVFKTNSAAVKRIVKPNGQTIFEVVGRVYGQPTAFPPAAPNGINIRLHSKHKDPNTWWEVKAWKEGLVPILGDGYVGDAKFTVREPLAAGDTIRVTAPIEDESDKPIKGRDGKVITGPDGKTPIVRINWLVNYASQIELIKRAEKPDFARLGKGKDKTEQAKPQTEPRIF